MVTLRYLYQMIDCCLAVDITLAIRFVIAVSQRNKEQAVWRIH